jgi:hypothetical protein
VVCCQGHEEDGEGEEDEEGEEGGMAVGLPDGENVGREEGEE